MGRGRSGALAAQNQGLGSCLRHRHQQSSSSAGGSGRVGGDSSTGNSNTSNLINTISDISNWQVQYLSLVTKDWHPCSQFLHRHKYICSRLEDAEFCYMCQPLASHRVKGLPALIVTTHSDQHTRSASHCNRLWTDSKMLNESVDPRFFVCFFVTAAVFMPQSVPKRYQIGCSCYYWRTHMSSKAWRITFTDVNTCLSAYPFVIRLHLLFKQAVRWQGDMQTNVCSVLMICV